eukprot:2911205-Pyramimonas_sp.AAC.1
MTRRMLLLLPFTSSYVVIYLFTKTRLKTKASTKCTSAPNCPKKWPRPPGAAPALGVPEEGSVPPPRPPLSLPTATVFYSACPARTTWSCPAAAAAVAVSFDTTPRAGRARTSPAPSSGSRGGYAKFLALSRTPE